jgi:hypothetical protein
VYLTGAVVAAVSLASSTPAAAAGPEARQLAGIEQLPPPPAETAAPAAVGDSYSRQSAPLCNYPAHGYGSGIISFIDYGKGAPGGGNNDDYIELVDSCIDHHGVKGWAWRNGRLVGEKYNGKGYRQRVIWDPFGDLQHGEVIGIKVCLVDGNNDPSAWPCSIERDRKVVNE